MVRNAYSYAPMSQRLPSGRVIPRWSVAGQLKGSDTTASIASEPARRAMVCVRPPLFASGPSIGFVLLIDPLSEPQPQLVPASRLLPAFVMVPTEQVFRVVPLLSGPTIL